MTEGTLRLWHNNSDRPVPTPPRIALFGEFGIGNLGNDISCHVLSSLLSEAVLGVELSAITRGSAGLDQVFDLRAVPISARERVLKLPSMLRPAHRVSSKLLDFVRLVRIVGAYDAVIVPGTGVLEDSKRWNPGGVLTWLLLLAIACRIRGVALVWFAVGGSLYRHWLPAKVAAWSGRWAQHRSFRDVTTAASLRRAGLDIPDTAITHDVVFSEIDSIYDESRSPAQRLASTIALSAIDYESGDSRSAYLQRLAGVAVSLLERGLNLVLVVGDDADELPTEDLMRLIELSCHPRAAAVRRIRRTDFTALSQTLQNTDLVVASRFHVLLAALKLHRPVIALSHASKDDDLLGQFGLSDYIHSIEDFTAEDIQASLDRLSLEFESVQHRLERGCIRANESVDADFCRMRKALHLTGQTA
jgi:polysaccharide pyruvyl transferase WcaK-like protein